MKHAKWCSVQPLSGKNKVYVCSWNSHGLYRQTSLLQALDGTGKNVKKGRNDQRIRIMHVPKWQTSRSLWLYIHQSARYVGSNFCGYLFLRFFPNRKNSQNIVPANNSNSKVCLWFRSGSADCFWISHFAGAQLNEGCTRASAALACTQSFAVCSGLADARCTGSRRHGGSRDHARENPVHCPQSCVPDSHRNRRSDVFTFGVSLTS